MLKHDEISNQRSCLNKAADDEPIFVLRANDELAPQIVRQWAAYYRARKADAGELTPERENKYCEAMQLANQMEEWKNTKSVYHGDNAAGLKGAVWPSCPECGSDNAREHKPEERE